MSTSSARKITFIFFLFLAVFSYAQSYNIDYYGIVSTEIDSNMSKMTSDLYYTQLSEISNFNVTDKRTESVLSSEPPASSFSPSNLSFYTVITKDKNSDRWITTLHVVDAKNLEEHTKTKQYDSFYKILMESKNELKDTIKQLIENDTNATAISSGYSDSPDLSGSSPASDISSTESLAGTWSGEENIQKIVILRGGRGFVIFKNGASMNITIELADGNSSNIIITQKGRGNASFYPELPRNLALNAALSAPPIQWILRIDGENNLSGTKVTLIQDGDSYKSGEIKVSWIKID